MSDEKIVKLPLSGSIEKKGEVSLSSMLGEASDDYAALERDALRFRWLVKRNPGYYDNIDQWMKFEP